MKASLLLAILLGFIAVVPSMSQSTATKTEKEVLQAIKKFNQAFRQADAALLEAMLTDQYIHSNSGSKVIDKKSWLNYIKKRRKQLDSQTLKVASYQMSEVVMKVYGNTVVVNVLITATGTRHQQAFQSKIRCTQVWVNQQGTWKRAAFHDSKLK